MVIIKNDNTLFKSVVNRDLDFYETRLVTVNTRIVTHVTIQMAEVIIFKYHVSNFFT